MALSTGCLRLDRFAMIMIRLDAALSRASSSVHDQSVHPS
jgi:hypothetical protein